MEKKKRYRLRRYHIGMKMRIGFWIVLIAVFSAIGLSYFQKINEAQERFSLYYTEDSSLDYSVCMNDPVRWPEICRDKGLTYIASAIDYIKTKFLYSFSATDILDYTYSYSIVATGSVIEKGGTGKPIDVDIGDVLLERKEVKMLGSPGFIISPSEDVNYNKYIEEIQEIKRQYNISVDSTLTVTMYIEIKGTHEKIKDEIVINREISMAVPLSEQTVDVSLSHQDVNNSEVIESTPKDNSSNIGYYTMCIVSVIFTVLSVIKLVLFISRVSANKTKYEKMLDKISREYNQVIVETKNVPETNTTRIIEVKSFEELLDAREVIGKPILSIKINNQKHWFLISNGDEIYKFVLKAVDLEDE